MPSPIAHASVALVVWPALSRGAPQVSVIRRRLLLAGLLFTLIAPDLDIALGMLLGDAFAIHGGPTHSLLAAAGWGFVFAAFCRVVIGRWQLLRHWAIGSAAYASHILLDALTHGRGVMMFWPWEQRIVSPVPLFYGVRHSQPGAWELHLITIGTELAFVALLWLAMRWWLSRDHRELTVPPKSAADCSVK